MRNTTDGGAASNATGPAGAAHRMMCDAKTFNFIFGAELKEENNEKEIH